MSSYPFYYEAKEKNSQAQIFLTDEEEKQRRRDYEEILGMKEHHSDQHERWNKAGNFYNIVQVGQGSDNVSQFAIGLSRTIIDTGVAMINEGEPEGSFKPLTPRDKKISILWDALAKHVLQKSNWRAHQKLWTTDLHIFGSSPLEAFINPVTRRPNEEPGAFLVRLANTARTGLRHRSIWNCFRNPYVSDPDEVPSGAYEEIVTHSYWITKYANRADFSYKYTVPTASKYKLTHIFNELENTYRIYCLPFGTMAEAQYEEQPNTNELGFPVLKKKLTEMNPLGMCPLSFGTFNDQLTNNYKQHSLYGMGIPQLIEGMEMIMEGLFNMTIDNMRLKNTVPIGYQPYQGQTDYPDLDSIGYMDSGRVFPGTFSPTSLGIADLQSNTVLWEWINNMCIWLTGYNFQQLGGDTSKTAFEFAQRLKANSNRALSRVKSLENGPLKRSWTMLLANTLSQVRQDEWEQVTDTQAEALTDLFKSGEISSNDYKFENGKIKSQRFVEYINVEDYDIEEDFSVSKKREFNPKSKKNTLNIKEQKGKVSQVPAVPEYLFPYGDIAQMMAFTTEVISKTMLGDLRVVDQQAIDGALANGVQLMPVVPQITPELMYGLWKQRAEDAGLNLEKIQESAQESEIMKQVKGIVENMESLSTSPQPNGLAQEQTQGMAAASPALAPATGATGVQSGPPEIPQTLQRFSP